MSINDQISVALKRFVVKNFDSIETIEILLLLRNVPDQSFAAEELTRILRSNLNSIESRLKLLINKGLVSLNKENRYCFDCKELETKKLVDELAENYIVRRFSIINMLYSGELSDLQQFAEAFDLRKKRDDG